MRPGGSQAPGWFCTVSTRQPSSVTATVCSYCADSLRSAVTAVPQDLHVGHALVDHRLDREGQARRQADATARLAEVGDLRLLVELPADAVADEVSDHRVAERLDVGLDRVTDVAEARARSHCGDPVPVRLERRMHQPHCSAAGATDRNRGRGVAMEAVEHQRRVDADDVTLAQHALAAGDAVADHLVDGGADALGEATVVERGAGHAVASREVDLEVVDVLGGHAGLELEEDPLEALGGEASDGAHRADLAAALGDQLLASGSEQHHREAV
jgi:hypothetical protein